MWPGGGKKRGTNRQTGEQKASRQNATTQNVYPRDATNVGDSKSAEQFGGRVSAPSFPLFLSLIEPSDCFNARAELSKVVDTCVPGADVGEILC